MACVAADREDAVREVAQVYELIKTQQPLLLLHCSSSSATTQLAQSLLSKALRALNVALSVMKQQAAAPAGGPVTPSVKAEPQLSAPIPASASDSRAIAPSTARRGANKRRKSPSVTMEGKKKKNSSSWVSLTTVPYDDGYGWRKYGEKKIDGTLFTRTYFMCTYKDDAGCQATKHVQQMDNSDPPTFQVIYNNDHTCSAKANSSSSSSSSSNLAALLAGFCNSSGEGSVMTPKINPSNGHAAAAAMNIKEEPPLQLPPLVEPSAIPYYDHMPRCQESQFFPPNMEQQLCGALPDSCGDVPSSVTGSCIFGETRDGYSGDMAAQMAASHGHDPLHDIEVFLMCDSFKDY